MKIMKKQKIIRIHPKKSIAFAFLLCATLACPACGADADTGTGQNTPSDTTDDNSDQQIPDNTTAEESVNNTEQTTDSVPQTDTSETGASENDITVTTFESNITIEMHTEEERKTADDGTVYLIKTYTYPTVTIEGNDAAAEKINADIRSRIDPFLSNTEAEGWAKEDYEYRLEESPDESFIAYNEDLSFKTERADSNVISFILNNYAYTGGAHGNSDIHGINYNPRTGELISFSDLSEDPAAFHEDTLAYNQALAKTEAYQQRMFSSESITDGSLESTLYADDAWYLSTSGLVFLSPPYALGPYASGTIEFIIPYSELAGMGFDPSYAYTDRLIMKLQENETCSFDLNGDGQEDSVLFRSENTENTDGSYGFLLHFTINDVDFSQTGDDTIKDYLSDLAWGEFYLYDMNIDDDYTELVVLSGENEADDYVYYSHFFRYTKDGDLLYLGKSKGDVSDPTVVISALN